MDIWITDGSISITAVQIIFKSKISDRLHVKHEETLGFLSPDPTATPDSILCIEEQCHCGLIAKFYL
jgi:hypothetical protein